MPEYSFTCLKDPFHDPNHVFTFKARTLPQQFLYFLLDYPYPLNDLIPDHKFSIDISDADFPGYIRVVFHSEQEIVVNKIRDFFIEKEYDTEWCAYIIGEMLAAIPPESGIFKYFYLN